MKVSSRTKKQKSYLAARENWKIGKKKEKIIALGNIVPDKLIHFSEPALPKLIDICPVVKQFTYKRF